MIAIAAGELDSWNWNVYFYSAFFITDGPECLPLSSRAHWSLGNWPLFYIQTQLECEEGRKILGFKLYGRGIWKWQKKLKSDNVSVNHVITPSRKSLLTGGDHCKMLWWTGCGSREGWRREAILEINWDHLWNKFVAISLHGCNFWCPSYMQNPGLTSLFQLWIDTQCPDTNHVSSLSKNFQWFPNADRKAYNTHHNLPSMSFPTSISMHILSLLPLAASIYPAFITDQSLMHHAL